MKLLGYLFLVLGAIALISVFFGYTHQLVMAVIGLGMARAILSEPNQEEVRKDKNEGRLQ